MHNDSHTQAGSEGRGLAGKRVMVVEDNGLLRYVIEQTLRGVGCEVVGPYSRLNEAMENAPSQQIDAALLDINIRGELVLPLAQQLRERGVPFMIASAYRAEELPRVLRGTLQLRKPFSDDDLLEGLQSLVANVAEGDKPH